MCAGVASVLMVAPAESQNLRGSRYSLDLQNEIARQHDFTYLGTSEQVRRFVRAGYLVPVEDNADFRLHRISFPYARPEVRLFVTRLGAQYRRACGERLVVTSLTRPRNRQPGNASSESVHPTGMALDLRRSNNGVCRRWLEDVLTNLERQGVLEATRERRPPHYHVAIFPNQYAGYVEALRTRGSTTARYQVRPGDSLWEIARRHGTTVASLRAANELRGNRIHPGQVLSLP